MHYMSMCVYSIYVSECAICSTSMITGCDMLVHGMHLPIVYMHKLCVCVVG